MRIGKKNKNKTKKTPEKLHPHKLTNVDDVNFKEHDIKQENTEVSFYYFFNSFIILKECACAQAGEGQRERWGENPKWGPHCQYAA